MMFDETEEKVVQKLDTPRRPYAVWTIGGTDYRLKLNSCAIVELENKFKKSLITVLAADGGNEPPSLGTMAYILTRALNCFGGGYTTEKVFAMCDDYFDEGHTQTDLFMNVMVDLLCVSGFFSRAEADKIQSSASDAKMNNI